VQQQLRMNAATHRMMVHRDSTADVPVNRIGALQHEQIVAKSGAQQLHLLGRAKILVARPLQLRA
jgi:hypothetical protein